VNVAALLVLASLGAPAPVAPPAPIVPADARRDLGARLIEYEQRLTAAALGEPEFEAADLVFDRLTATFFTGDLAAASLVLDDRIAEIAGFEGGDRLLLAHRLRSERLVVAGATEYTARLECPYSFEPEVEIESGATLELAAPAGGVIATASVVLRATEDGVEPVTARFTIPAPGLAPGSHGLFLRSAAQRVAVATIDVFERSFDAEREAFAARLAAQAPGIARSIAQGRVSKLRDVPVAGDTFPLVTPASRLLLELRDEVAAIERGEDPYWHREGEWWRSVESDGGSVVPLRIFAPSLTSPAPESAAKLPLIVAFHGMGGDETMFFHSYGAGAIKALATERRFIAVAPLTYPLVRDGALLATIVAAVAASYPIDEKRIHVIGHSLGAAAAIVAATPSGGPGSPVASLALFGGGATRLDAELPPTILFLGERDTIVPLARFSAALEAPRDGLTVRVLPRRGHTLMVGEHLAAAIDFLFAHPSK
jgi:predicted esterase